MTNMFMIMMPASAIMIVLMITMAATSIDAFTIPRQSQSVLNGKQATSSNAIPTTLHQYSHVRRAASKSQLFSSPTSFFGNDDQATYDEVCDVLVLGSGPGGRAIASLLSAKSGANMNVILADQNYDREWAPNYGAWQDEWDGVVDKYMAAGVELGGGNVGKSIDREWSVTECFFGGSFGMPMDDRLRLDRAYYRVDKFALAESLSTDSYKVLKANHRSEAIGLNIYKPAGSILHDEDGTTIQLYARGDNDNSNGGEVPVTVRAKIIVDTTGHETKLVLKDARDQYTPPGFQIAYGALVEVDESDVADTTKFGPYDKEVMTLFDYRTDHFEPESAQLETAIKSPTFNYVMPLKDNLVFFEETSLVARPAISFQECRDRLDMRFKYHGIKPIKVIEEEFCYIPMGGALPQRDQRILAFAGAAAMVHPSTGYHLCRAMMGATFVAEAIQKEMTNTSNNNDNQIERAVAAGYNAIWSPENIRQRNFATFGGEYLMKQDVVGLRGFFTGFFKLPLELWGGFLAGWPGLVYNENHETWYNRLWYGLNFVVKLPPSIALDMAINIVQYSLSEGISLPQAVTPLFGEPKSFEYKRNNDRIGDIAAKEEAMAMIKESASLPRETPVALEEK